MGHGKGSDVDLAAVHPVLAPCLEMACTFEDVLALPDAALLAVALLAEKDVTAVLLVVLIPALHTYACLQTCLAGIRSLYM